MRTLLSRRTFLAAALARERRPNVVFFMTDDHGAWATGAYGCREIHTPNIDRLAAGGARFTRAFAATPVCSPSRLTWLTGKLPSRHGVQDWLRPVDSFGAKSRQWLEGHETLSEILVRNGYTAGMCGKWHMGLDDTAQARFTYWSTVPGGGGPYRDPEMVTNGVRAKRTGYKTDLITDSALDFLDRTAKSGPFFLYMPFYAPHTPYDYQPEAYRRPYENSGFSCFPRESVHANQNRSLRNHHGRRESMLAYSALVTGVDHNIGRVLRRLEELGVRDNTLVIFSADQGFNCGHHGVWGKGNGTVPFNLYDESIQIPLIWNHPGRIAPGEVLPPMVSTYDFLPTLLEYLDVRHRLSRDVVGRSYAGFLAGKRPSWRNRLYFEYAYVRGIRSENLKYVERTKDWPSEFYDLESDPGEKRNLISEVRHRRQIDTLKSDMDQFFRRGGAPPLERWRDTTRQELTVYERP